MQQNYNWMLLASCSMAVLLCYFMRYFQERNKRPKPDAKFQFVCSVALSYLAYFLHPSIKDFIKVPFTDGFRPFSDMHVWLGFISYLAAYLVKQFDSIFKRGWKEWARDVATKVLAYTDKK